MAGSIIKISEAASIAFHAMRELVKNQDKLLSVKEIAERIEVSANHLSKIMQRLNKAGFIDSVKGFNGGFRLAIEPSKLTFLEIYELFDGKIQCSDCFLTHKKCDNACMFDDLIASVNAQVREKFATTKLSDIAQK